MLWNGIYSGSNTMQQNNPSHLYKWLQICVFLIVITLQKECTRYLLKNSLKNISTVSFEIVDFPYSKLPPHFIKLDLNIIIVLQVLQDYIRVALQVLQDLLHWSYKLIGHNQQHWWNRQGTTSKIGGGCVFVFIYLGQW